MHRMHRIILYKKNSNFFCQRPFNYGIQTRMASAAAGSASGISLRDLRYDAITGIVSNVNTNNNKNAAIQFQTVIGIEVHAQLNIPTKLFSSARTLSSSGYNYVRPNTRVEAYDMAYPGSLPSLSADAVKAAVLAAHALKCNIHELSRFERKHYTYADMPNGYQVTQQRWPLASKGLLRCRLVGNDNPNAKKKKGRIKSKDFNVGIERIQLEQDSGKTTARRGASLVDLNRAGCALIEIVSSPDIRSADEAGAALSTLHQLLRHIGVCDGKMEEGSLRCDLNVSIAPILHDGYVAPSSGSDLHESNPFASYLPINTGHRVEVKNLNSFKQVVAAAEFEARRQAYVYLQGNPTSQDTRTFDVATGKTVVTRNKEGSIDYRFMPEPDLPPLVLNKETLGISLHELIETLPELPEELCMRLKEEYGLTEDVALIIGSDVSAVNLFELAVATAKRELNGEHDDKDVARSVANWFCNDLLGLVKESWSYETSDYTTASVSNSAVNGERLGVLVAMIFEGTLSSRLAKNILAVMFKEEHDKGPREIAEERGWRLITDPIQIKSICTDVILDRSHRSQYQQYLNGGRFVTKLEKYFIGKVMSATKGTADPEGIKYYVREVLQEQASNR